MKKNKDYYDPKTSENERKQTQRHLADYLSISHTHFSQALETRCKQPRCETLKDHEMKRMHQLTKIYYNSFMLQMLQSQHIDLQHETRLKSSTHP
jgi:hypothetical protein